MGFNQRNRNNQQTLVATTTIATAATLPTGTITVTSTTGFPASGNLVAINTLGAITSVVYTGVTATTFTGCTLGAGTLAVGTVISATSVLTGAAPQVLAGKSLLVSSFVDKGSVLTASVDMNVKTLNLVMTPSWQGSFNNIQWRPIAPQNNAAAVGTVAGTGTAVATMVDLVLPAGQPPYKYVRAIVTSTAAVADGVADSACIAYNFNLPDSNA